MTNKPAAIVLVWALFVFKAGMAIAQAPNISYQSPQVYPVNTSITPLTPTNTGGIVPPNIYSQVSTFVGTGKVGSSDGTGTSASLSAPLAMAIDAAGNIYVSDYNNNTIRKITIGGVVSTIAGTAGIHGAANGANATFSLPEGLAVDQSGNIYIADSYNDLIRKLMPDGTVSTYAGATGITGSQDGTGATANFYAPNGLAVDKSGNVYVADQNNNTIRKITPVGSPIPMGAVTTLAGTAGKTGSQDGAGATASFNSPAGLAIDATGNIYVADAGNNLIRKTTPAGLVTTLAGSGIPGSSDGVGAAASFYYPTGIAIDPSGILYVADEKNNLIRKITPDGTVTTLAGSGSGGSVDGVAKNAAFSYPGSVVADGNGNIYAGDLNTYLIRKIGITGYTIDKPLPAGLNFDVKTGIITGTPIAASPATNYTVTGYNALGNSSTVVNIAVTNKAVVVLAPDISYQTPQVYAVSQTISPLAPVNTGGAVPATDYGQAVTFAGSGAIGSANGQGTQASFFYPGGIVKDNSGNIFVSDFFNHLIREISPTGAVTTFAGNGSLGSADGQGTAASFENPAGLAIDATGNIYVADYNDNLIRKITPGGLVSTFAGRPSAMASIDGPIASAGFYNPYSLVFDPAGNLYVAEESDLLRKISPAGVVTTLANFGPAAGQGTAESFVGPNGLTIDAAGNLYVADAANNIIKKITPAGVVSTFAGSGTQGSADGVALSATFDDPTGLVFDASGNLYVSQQNGVVIRKITPAGMVITLAGSMGPPNEAGFNVPHGLAIDNNTDVLYVADDVHSLIYTIPLTGYTIDKPLSAGLTFDATTGIITGTPTVISPATDYTITAYNAGGSSSTVVNIMVKLNSVNGVPPPNISYQTPHTYLINKTIASLSPANTGGAVPAISYAEVTTIAGTGKVGNANGAALSATFNNPTDLVFDGAGNLFITEYKNNDIREITPAGVVSTFAGDGSQGKVNGQGTVASFNAPYGITADVSGDLYVADEGNQLIRKITAAGLVSTFAGDGSVGTTNGAIGSSDFANPYGLVFDAASDLLIADRGNSVIRKIDVAGQVSTFATLEQNNGSTDVSGTFLGFLAMDPSGNLYVPDNNQVKKIDLAGGVTVLAGSTTPGIVNATGTSAQFSRLNGIAVDSPGNVYVADADNNMIRKITAAGVVATLAGSGGRGGTDGTGYSASFYAPYGVTVDNTGNFLYVTDTFEQLIRKIGITGYAIDKSLPTGMSFDATTGVISGTPGVTSPPTTYTITAYNTGGSSSATVNIEVVNPQTVAFGPMSEKTVCDPDFDPGATGSAAITYSSSDTTIAKIVAGEVHIMGAGTAEITADDGTSQQKQPLKVTAAVTPSVSISPDTSDGCKGADVTYNATPTNGGSNPFFQWQVNGKNTGTNSRQFTVNNLKNNDQVTCVLTSNAACLTGAKATSNTATFILDDAVTTSVTITSSAAGPICPGSPVTFTAVPVTPDSNPGYQWLINNFDAGINSNTFTTTSLADGDVVTVILTSNGKCLINPQAPSNSIKISVNPVNLCTISIPNAFTPNGDGINDLWNVTALVSYPACTVNVFNRYGSLVYSSIGYPKPWDGTNSGKPLPTGTYYYIIDPKNGAKKISGFVTILR